MAVGAERKIHIPTPKVPRGLKSALLYAGLLAGGSGAAIGGAYASGVFDSEGGNQRDVQPPVVRNFEMPTPTATLIPTDTPEPTLTPTPEPTETPMPVLPTEPPRPIIQPTARVVQQATAVPEPTSLPETFVELRPTEEQEIMNLINSDRQGMNLNPLSFNANLRTAAENYVMYLHNSNWLKDVCANCQIPNPHTRNGDPQSRAKAAGYPGTASEVLGGFTVTNPNAVLGPNDFGYFVQHINQGWRNSLGHWQTITGNWTEIGVGCIYDSNLVSAYPRPIRQLLCVAMVGKR